MFSIFLATFPVLSYIWYQIGNYLCETLTNKNFKVSRTYVSVIHAMTVILSYLLGIPGYILLHLSITYYIVDTMYELMNLLVPEKENRKIKIYDLGMLLHHVISMITLTYFVDQKVEYYVFRAFYLAEISNLPMYVVYQLKANGYKNNYVLKTIIAIEALAYIVLRLVIGGKITYDMFFENDIPSFVFISAILMLIISAVWTNKLVKQLFV
jgi:hypothetical protein